MRVTKLRGACRKYVRPLAHDASESHWNAIDFVSPLSMVVIHTTAQPTTTLHEVFASCFLFRGTVESLAYILEGLASPRQVDISLSTQTQKVLARSGVSRKQPLGFAARCFSVRVFRPPKGPNNNVLAAYVC